MEKHHFLWVDLLKITSIFSVILIHIAAPLLVNYNEVDKSIWWIGNFYDSIARWCIPIFLMLSGAFTIENTQQNSLKHFLFQRCQRILIPFLIWSFFYFLWRIYINGEDLAIHSFLFLFFKEPLYYHLWFLYVLILLYVFTPIFAVYIKNANRINTAYFFIVLFTLTSVVPTIKSFFITENIFSKSPFSFVQYIGYFVLGYALRDTTLKTIGILICTLLFILAFLTTLFGTFYLTALKSDGVFNSLFYEYLSFNVFVMSITIFLIVKSTQVPHSLQKIEYRYGILRAIALCVPGIYLIHAMIIAIYKRGLLKIPVTETTFHISIGIPLFACIIFASSFGVVFIIKRIPVIKYCIP